MTALVILGDIGFFFGGAAVVWFFKPNIQLLVMTANQVSAKLHAEADKIKAAM